MRKKIDSLYAIESRIQQESNSYMADILSVFTDDASDKKIERIEHEIAIISLRSLKIAYCIKLKEYEVLEGELHLLLESIKDIEIEKDLTCSVISDGYDCILSVMDRSDEEAIRSFFKKAFGDFTIYNSAITEDTFFLLSGISDYFLNNDDDSIAAEVLQYLVEISSERNKEYPDRHREIVVRALLKIVDKCPEQSYVICKKERNWFKGVYDEYSSDFLWYSGSLLLGRNKLDGALSAFKSCYAIRSKIYGETNWFTILARREYSIIILNGEDKELKKEECSFLQCFVNGIEEGAYPEVDDSILKTIEGQTLYVILLYKLNHNDFFSFKNFHLRYQRICEVFNENKSEPLIKLRLCHNLIGCYFLKKGDYIQAERAFNEATDALFPDGTVEIITKSQVQSNLLMAYYAENDLERALPLLLELLELIDCDKNAMGERDRYRVLTLYNSLISQAFLEPDKDEISFLISELDNINDKIYSKVSNNDKVSSEMAIFFITGIQMLYQNACLTVKQCEKYSIALASIDESNSVQLEQGQMVVLLLIQAIIRWELKRKDLAEKSILRAVELTDNAVIPLNTKAAVLQIAAGILCGNGKEANALSYLNRALFQVKDIWHSYMHYFNDSRLLRVLSPVQLIFTCSYTIMRKIDNDNWRLFERLLNYKAIASLAGKERNRFLNYGKFDINLIKRIKTIQDRIAAIEAESIFLSKSNEYEEEKNKLRILEAEFASKFPKDLRTKDLSIPELQERIPDNSVVVEYLLCYDDFGVSSYDNGQDLRIFDVFVIVKRNGRCSIERRTILHAGSIIEEASEFINIFIDESKGKLSIDDIEKKESLRHKLYDALIIPILELFSDVECNKVFLAPDAEIVNLPFEILADKRGELLGDRFNIVILECARDFLYSDKNQSGRGSLIMGNPQYDVKENMLENGFSIESGQDKTRLAGLNPDNIKQLPFSGIEAKLAAKYCDSVFFVGKGVNKKLLLKGKGKRNIHLATHGYYDLSEKADAIYSSCLLFSGISNWLRNNEAAGFDNGMVTADEISRFDFHDVELVVMSSCLSGLNDVVISKGFQGLVGGFSAAGVKYVISSLWSVDDFATALLMDAFYYHYGVKKLSPPSALKIAKQYMRRVTIRDLKKRNWFNYVLQEDVLNDEMKELIGSYVRKNERFRPFKNEIYWAGFTCFRCN